MANTVTITLDTAAPAGPSITLAAGAATVTARDIAAAIATTDPATAGYQMKIYGDVDDAFDVAEYRALEANAPWIAFTANKNIRLSAVDGVKTVRVKIRDDVNNVSAEATDVVTLDTAVPTVNVSSGPNPARISKQTGARTSSFTWSPNRAISEYKIKLVASINDPDSVGVQIPTAAGSQNVSGGPIASGALITTQIDGADLETAGVDGNAAYNGGSGIVKVFARDAGSGLWSV